MLVFLLLYCNIYQYAIICHTSLLHTAHHVYVPGTSRDSREYTTGTYHGYTCTRV